MAIRKELERPICSEMKHLKKNNDHNGAPEFVFNSATGL